MDKLKIKFLVEKREAYGEIEWVLKASIEHGYYDWWVMQVYKKEPTKDIIEQDKTLILRSIELYVQRISLIGFPRCEEVSHA